MNELGKTICNSIQENKDKIEKLTKQNERLKKQNKKLKEDKKKAIEHIKKTIKIIKEQPSSCELNDIWTLEHLNSFLEILGDGNNE